MIAAALTPLRRWRLQTQSRRLLSAVASDGGDQKRVPKVKKSFGQHFLTDHAVVDRIAACAVESLKGTRRVATSQSPKMLEIGPGSGNLTDRLLQLIGDIESNDEETPVRLECVEVDRRMVPVLRERFSNDFTTGRMVLHHADILEFLDDHVLGGDKEEVCEGNLHRKFDTVVGNLPYNISSPIFHRLATSLHSSDGQSLSSWWNCAIVMTQKEFADRVTVGNMVPCEVHSGVLD